MVHRGFPANLHLNSRSGEIHNGFSEASEGDMGSVSRATQLYYKLLNITRREACCISRGRFRELILVMYES